MIVLVYDITACTYTKIFLSVFTKSMIFLPPKILFQLGCLKKLLDGALLLAYKTER